MLLDPTNDYAAVELRKAREEQAKLDAERNDRVADGQDEEEGEGPARRHADARARERPAHQPELPAAQADQADLPRARRRRRHQRHLRPAAQGRQRLDRPDQHPVPEGARDADAPGEPLLQGHRRAHDPHRGGHAAEPEDLRGPRHPDVLPVERRTSRRSRTRSARCSRRRASRSTRRRTRSRCGTRPTRSRSPSGSSSRTTSRSRRSSSTSSCSRSTRTRRTTLGTAALVPHAIGATIPAPGGMTNLGASLADGPVHVGPAQADLDQLVRIQHPVSDPDQLHQGQHGRGAARQAAAPHRRGAEGAARHRRQGPDPRDELQHVERSVGRNVVPDHVVPVPGHRHQDRGRAPRPPQQGGHAEADDSRSRNSTGRAVTLRRHAAADHRHADDLVEHPAQGRRDELPRGALSAPTRATRRRRSRSSATSRSSAGSSRTSTRASKTTDLVLTLTPHIIRIPDITEEDLAPGLRRHGREHLVPGHAARREPEPRPGALRAAPRRRQPPSRQPPQGQQPPGQSRHQPGAGRRADRHLQAGAGAAGAAAADASARLAAALARPCRREFGERARGRRRAVRRGGRVRGVAPGAARLRSRVPVPRARAAAGRGRPRDRAREASRAGPSPSASIRPWRRPSSARADPDRRQRDRRGAHRGRPRVISTPGLARR